ncbi:MAG: hypothetical protein LC689_10100 [Myxococcales bacterium]|nr:hypothetical protein [Myxococcales bacterium]
MRTPYSILLASVAACYAQVEDGSVAVTHSLCTPSTSACIPGGRIPITTFNYGGNNTFTMNLGDVPFLQSSSSAGPVTLQTNLGLNKASFDILTSGADFKGITQVQLLRAPRASTGAGDEVCPPSANCPVVALYKQSTDGVADQQIVLKSQVPNLIDLVDQTNHNIVFEVTVQGTAPQPTLWDASFTMDLALSARAGLP